MTRDIRINEKEIINFLLDKASLPELKIKENAVVKDLKDGLMGGFRFIGNYSDGRKYGKKLVEAKYLDSDNIPVYLSLIIDNKEMLYELDIWKVDFNPLIEYPKLDQLTNIELSKPNDSDFQSVQ